MSDQGAETTAGSGSGLAILAAVCAGLLAGMVFGAALWIVAAVAAAMLVGLNAVLTRIWSTAAIASRDGHDCEVKIGSVLPVTISITNPRRLPILWLLAEDLLPHAARFFSPPALEIEGQTISVLLLWSDQTKRLEYTLRFQRRGYFQIGPTILETGDVMGLYRRYRVGTQPVFVTVLPNVVPLSAYEVGSRRPIGEIRMRERVMDDPTRLRGIRQWQLGDPMRSVHWAATARTGVLHSKVYEPSSIIGATIVLDLHASTTPKEHEPARSDLAITAAASVAAALHEANEPVGFLSNGRDAADRIRQEGWSGDHRIRGEATAAASMKDQSDRLRPVLLAPSRGPIHLAEILRTLARLERTDGLTLSQLLIECESRLSGETTLFVILQRCTEETMAALIGLSRRGRAVAVMINTHDINDYSAIAGPLIAARIPTYHLASPDAVADVCRQTLLR